MGNLSFIPKILLCGDDLEFISQVGNRPFKIVGHVQFTGKVDGGGLSNKLCQRRQAAFKR